MGFIPRGRHLIAGEWVGGGSSFQSAPATGLSHRFSMGTSEDVDRACQAAEEAFWSYGYSSRKERAAFLYAIADEIEARGDLITQIGSEETGLPEARLTGERGRTVEQLRLFARLVTAGDYLDRRHYPALPNRSPAPRPELKALQRPIGPVAIFGASNFPLAFSTAGGDSAAALAAGCPIVVKGHPAHPGTGEIVAEAIDAARHALGLRPGVFSFIQGDKEAGTSLVQNPLIKAVGFTGSLKAGRALFNLCAARPEPIPFFGELGCVNPVFLLPAALEARAVSIGAAWADSLLLGAGQFCTNPGVVIAIEGLGYNDFLNAAREKLAASKPQVMLTENIAQAYETGSERMAATPNVDVLLRGGLEQRKAAPSLCQTSATNWLDHPSLGEEVFGPAGLVVKARNREEILAVATALNGQLTATLHLDAKDKELGLRMMPILERKAGRVLANGFPTGVEVVDAMVHGGPYPASTNFGATSVGTLSIRRFLRTVSYQNIPEALLPEDLQ